MTDRRNRRRARVGWLLWALIFAATIIFTLVAWDQSRHVHTHRPATVLCSHCEQA